MFCPKCGKEIPNQATFCPKCGAAVSSAARSAAPETPSSAAQGRSATAVKEKPPKKKRGRKVIIAALLIVAAVLLLPKLFGAPDESPPEEDVPAQDDTIDPAADQTAELLTIIDETEAALSDTFDKYAELDPINHFDQFDKDGDGYIDDIAPYVEAFRQQAQVYAEFITVLEENQQAAAALSIPDAKTAGAAERYFSQMHDAAAAYENLAVFQADYQDFYQNVVSCRPVEADFSGNISGYYEALNQWLGEVQTGYAAIACPACAESEWERYGEILEYNDGVARKVAQAIQYNDWLRFYSSENMTGRYRTVEANRFGRLVDCTNGEINHIAIQGNSASDLAAEIHTFCELTPEEREAYEFENIRTGELILDYEVTDTIYPSLYNTYDAFAIVKTGCISGTRSIVVEAEIEGFTQQYRESFNLDSSYKAIYIKPPAMTGELDLTAAKPAQLKITVSEKDGTLIEAKTFDITLKSKYDFEWYSDEYGNATQDNILCFLTPEADAIAKLKRAAIDEISDMTGDTVQSFVGYQPIFSNNYGTTYIQVAGLMRALYEDMGVRYNMNPFSISGSSQHIQLPEDVIANQSGLCVETSLVIASALQSANMHAFLVFPPGHAQVAVEVWNSGEQVGEYFLIETTALDSSNSKEYFIGQANALLNEGTAPTGIITYYSAAGWADYLKNEVEYIVDCNDARLLGMTPFAH